MIAAFLLIVTLGNAQLFALPLADADACQANAKSLVMMLNPKIGATVHCFDLLRQVDQQFGAPSAPAPAPAPGESVE